MDVTLQGGMKMLSVQNKIIEAVQKTKDYLANKDLSKVYISYSGGKDSTSVLKIIELAGLKNKIDIGKVVLDTIYSQGKLRYYEMLKQDIPFSDKIEKIAADNKITELVNSCDNLNFCFNFILTVKNKLIYNF